MFDFHEKRKIRKVLYSKIFISFIVLVTFFIGLSVRERYVIERETASRLHERAEELYALKTRAALLESQVDHLEDERGIEEELRTRFDVAKEGEQVIILLDEEAGKGEKSASSPSAQPEKKPSFFSRFQFW